MWFFTFTIQLPEQLLCNFHRRGETEHCSETKRQGFLDGSRQHAERNVAFVPIPLWEL